MRLRSFQYCRLLFLFYFYICTVCLCYLSYIVRCTLSSISLSFVPLKIGPKYFTRGNCSVVYSFDDNLFRFYGTSTIIGYLMSNPFYTNKQCSFFLVAVVSILLYGCTTWTLTKCMGKKLDGNYTRMLEAILNKSWRQHPTKQQLYDHLPPISETIVVRRTRHSGHCWSSKDEFISDVLLGTSLHRRAKAERPARNYIQQLCTDTRCIPEHLLEAMDDREVWRERVRDIRADGAT